VCEQVSSCVTFLLSPAAAYVTGTCVRAHMCVCVLTCHRACHDVHVFWRRRGGTGDTMRVDGGSSLSATLWPLEDHDNMPVFGTLPDKAKAKL
jgi:hypothetical protein